MRKERTYYPHLLAFVVYSSLAISVTSVGMVLLLLTVGMVEGLVLVVLPSLLSLSLLMVGFWAIIQATRTVTQYFEVTQEFLVLGNWFHVVRLSRVVDLRIQTHQSTSVVRFLPQWTVVVLSPVSTKKHSPLILWQKKQLKNFLSRLKRLGGEVQQRGSVIQVNLRAR